MTRLARYLFASVFLSAMLAALLSLIPGLAGENKEEGKGIPAFRLGESTQLSERTLVDFLLEHQLDNQIIYADWQEPELTLHLVADPQGEEDRLYRDLFMLIKGGLVTTDNVQRVRLNVYDDDQVSDQYKFSILANRAQLEEDPSMKNHSRLPYREYIENAFQVIPHNDI